MEVKEEKDYSNEDAGSGDESQGEGQDSLSSEAWIINLFQYDDDDEPRSKRTKHRCHAMRRAKLPDGVRHAAVLALRI